MGVDMMSEMRASRRHSKLRRVSDTGGTRMAHAQQERPAMPHLDQNAIKVTEALERHPALSLLQVASRAELSVSAATEAVAELAAHGLIQDDDGVFSLDTTVLSELLETA